MGSTSLNCEWPCSPPNKDTIICPNNTTWSHVVRNNYDQSSKTPSLPPPPLPRGVLCRTSPPTGLLESINVVTICPDYSVTWPGLNDLTRPPPSLSVPKSASKSKKSASVSQVDVYKGPDRISELSNDILHTILCSLDMKDAAQTSILSRRWRYLWTYREDLEFDHKRIMKKRHTVSNHLKIYSQRSRYVNWVDQVIKVHHGNLIDKFKVSSLFEEPFHYTHIDTWVRFALSKKVKELYLDASLFCKRTRNYTLGFEFLKRSPSLCESSMSRLTSLHLNQVNVSGDFLQFLLCQCHVLEQLIVLKSDDLVSFDVVNPSLSLKHLVIASCPNLKRIEIDVPSLISFHYGDKTVSPVQLLFKNVPNLVVATFASTWVLTPDLIFQQITCIAKQLFELYVGFQSLLGSGYTIDMERIPCFSNVKYLELLVFCSPQNGFLCITDFLRAFPMLRDLTLRVNWHGGEHPPEAPKLSSEDVIKVAEPEDEDTLHKYLRTIVVDGFLGCPHDVDVLLEIVKFAPVLKMITCKPGKNATKLRRTVFDDRCLRFAAILAPGISVITSE